MLFHIILRILVIPKNVGIIIIQILRVGIGLGVVGIGWVVAAGAVPGGWLAWTAGIRFAALWAWGGIGTVARWTASWWTVWRAIAAAVTRWIRLWTALAARAEQENNRDCNANNHRYRSTAASGIILRRLTSTRAFYTVLKDSVPDIIV